MKTPTIVLIAVPLGLLFWLFWRRTRTGVDENSPGHRPAAADIVTDEINAAVPDAERLPECSPFEERDEESARDIETDPEKAQAEVVQADACPQSPRAEAQPSGGVDGTTKTIADIETGPSEGLPCTKAAPAFLPPIEVSGEDEQPAAEEIVVAGITGAYSPVAVATSTPGDGLQGEPAVTETAFAEAGQSVGNELIEAGAERTPQRYRPPPQKPPRQAITRPVNQVSQRAAPAQVPLEIRIRTTFDRFGFCAIGLLPERTSELDNEVAVKFGGRPLLLMAQEDWYQDLQLENLGVHLRQGVELRGTLTDKRSVRWLLTGRDLYVLASHQRASGFVSTNRLALGRSHVVLCRSELLQQVEVILAEAGCEGYTTLDESHGIPSGWVGLRGVSPTKAIPLNLGSDPFYALKPAPDIEIDFEGGICLRNSVWLAGYPPRIKLLGEPDAAVKILIDGEEAQRTAEGFVIVDGYDLSGQHSVYCEGLSCSRSYSIEEPPDSWQEWPAYHFAQADICGPLVQLTPEAVSRRAFTVPMSNPLLLGAEPGQVFRCSHRSVSLWKGFVPFDVVWALPAQPLGCNKKTARILQFSEAPVALPQPRTKRALGWSNAILDASRKGLRIENGSPDSMARWSAYKKAARSIWRAAR